MSVKSKAEDFFENFCSILRIYESKLKYEEVHILFFKFHENKLQITNVDIPPIELHLIFEIPSFKN